MSAEVDPESPFGKFQKSQPRILETRPKHVGNRYSCTQCDEVLMSDEALQLHKLGHLLAALTCAIDRIRNEGIVMRRDEGIVRRHVD